MVRDSADGLPEGADFGELRFAAAVPLRTADGLLLGFLIIADTSPRPEFSDDDLLALDELAHVLANNMELSMIASEAEESKLAAQEADQRFRAIVEAAPTLILQVALDGHCTFAPERWASFAGNTVIDQSVDGWVNAIHPEHRQKCSVVYWEAIRKREPFTFACSLRRFDGEYIAMLVKGVPHLSHDLSCEGFVVACVDLTGVA